MSFCARLTSLKCTLMFYALALVPACNGEISMDSVTETEQPEFQDSIQQPAVVVPGFQENQLLSGHTNPVGIRFVKAAGPLRAVVFEKGGRVYYYDDLSFQAVPAQAKLVADLSNNTHDYWD